MDVLNLQKGDVLNLKKDFNKLNSIDLGLGWDVSNNEQSWDLDVSAIMIDVDGQLFETIYYGHLYNNCIKLNGDNLTGVGDGDDEIITVNLSNIPSNVKTIGFFVNIFSAGNRDFSKVKNAYIRMVNNDTHDEVCRYKLNENGKGFNAFHFANLEKVDNEWKFKAVGEGTNGNISQLKNYFVDKINNITVDNSTNDIVATPDNKGVKKSLLARIFGK